MYVFLIINTQVYIRFSLYNTLKIIRRDRHQSISKLEHRSFIKKTNNRDKNQLSSGNVKMKVEELPLRQEKELYRHYNTYYVLPREIDLNPRKCVPFFPQCSWICPTVIA